MAEKRLDKLDVLRALLGFDRADVLTWEVLESLPGGAAGFSRHQVYRRLDALERDGLVSKDISHGGNGIGMALWTPTEPGRALLADNGDSNA